MNSRRGFSLIELVMVIAIMLAIAAMAMPKFLTFAATYQLRSGLDSVAGVVQQTRVNAVRGNKVIQVQSTASGNSSIIYGDTDASGTWSNGEPGAQLPKQVQIKTSGYPGNAYTSVSTYSAESQSTAIKFNARGLPCVVISGICENLDTSGATNVPVGFVLYVQNTGKYGLTGWGAVTITPAGRIQEWIWNGSSYSQQ
jgi:prepilin-type N-terminal cleavage/methylation domain-containing protein